MQAADDVVEVAAVDRISRVGVRTHDGPKLVGLGPHRDTRQQDTRHHHFSGGPVTKVKQVAQYLPGLTAQQAAFLAFLNDELELLGGVIALAIDFASLDARQPQQPVAHGIEPDDERQDRVLQSSDERRHVERRLVRPL